MSTLIQQIDSAESRFSKAFAEIEKNLQEFSKYDDGQGLDWKNIDTPARLRTRLEGLGYYTEADALMEFGELTFNPLERILGANELSSVQFFEQGVLAARSVARVQIKSASGSKET